MDKKSSFTFTYRDPGMTFEGTPYEAASEAVYQSQRMAMVLDRALRDTYIQVRNAWMQRNLDLGGKPNASEFDTSPEGRILKGLLDANLVLEQKLNTVRKSASYDPKNPPKEE